MSESIQAKVEKLPTGVSGVAMGFVTGYMFDKVACYLYLTFVPEEQRPHPPIFEMDDWIVFGVSALIALKNNTFGFGMLIGALISSGAFF